MYQTRILWDDNFMTGFIFNQTNQPPTTLIHPPCHFQSSRNRSAEQADSLGATFRSAKWIPNSLSKTASLENNDRRNPEVFFGHFYIPHKLTVRTRPEGQMETHLPTPVFQVQAVSFRDGWEGKNLHSV